MNINYIWIFIHYGISEKSIFYHLIICTYGYARMNIKLAEKIVQGYINRLKSGKTQNIVTAEIDERSKILSDKLNLNVTGWEKYEVEKIFEKNYNHKIVKKESGNIRIRFLVNCKGVSGRYRIIGMDKNYKEKHFDTSITNQLLSITQRLVKWKPFIKNNIQRDYYQYLIFKIEKGELIEILP